MSGQNPLLEKAVSLDGSPEAIREFYAGWAEDYDADLLDEIGYVGPSVAAAALAKLTERTAAVLDAGCGTGLVGKELYKRNADLKIDGVDLTPEMLAVAGRTGAYRSLNTGNLSSPMAEIDDNTYDGIVSAGVFTNGHVGPEGIDPLIRIAKSGAPIVLTIRDSAWEADGFKDKIEQLKTDGRITAAHITHSPYHTKEDIYCQLCVMEVA